MARETKKQREDREEAERKVYQEECRNSYPQKFREVLAAAISENFCLIEVNPLTGLYTLNDRDEGIGYEVFDTFGPGQWALNDLKEVVCDKVQAREEERKQYNLRQTAMAKLTPEERKALKL